ncbi:hypothetical protein OF83DRAFT_1290762, partial [Amylostereum chailletii]
MNGRDKQTAYSQSISDDACGFQDRDIPSMSRVPSVWTETAWLVLTISTRGKDSGAHPSPTYRFLGTARARKTVEDIKLQGLLISISKPRNRAGPGVSKRKVGKEVGLYATLRYKSVSSSSIPAHGKKIRVLTLHGLLFHESITTLLLANLPAWPKSDLFARFYHALFSDANPSEQAGPFHWQDLSEPPDGKLQSWLREVYKSKAEGYIPSGKPTNTNLDAAREKDSAL